MDRSQAKKRGKKEKANKVKLLFVELKDTLLTKAH